jgi:2-polyprenyl-3-methyl-5-hydroxy-6-metoxy-1,4-benzoquinol methylase
LINHDPFAELKQRQREMCASFGPTAMFTTPVADHVVRFAGIAAGETVLDVGTGTGVLAITAARMGAKVIGLDLTPELIEQARENADRKTPLVGATRSGRRQPRAFNLNEPRLGSRVDL